MDWKRCTLSYSQKKKKFIELKYWPILNEMALLTIEDSIISKEKILFYCSFYLVITVQEFENM